MLNIQPKTSGAAIGASLGLVIVAILHSIPGVHLAPEASAAIPAFLSTLGAYLVPSSPSPTPAPPQAPPVTATVSSPPGGPTPDVPPDVPST